jgi:hypothetical protein
VTRIAETLRSSGMPPLLLRFWKWILISTACSFVFTATMILTLHNDFAYGILRLWNDGFWWDLWVFEERFRYFRTPAFWNAFRYPFTYPAAMGVVLAVLFRIPHILRWYLLTCIAALCGWAWIVAREMAVRGAIARRIALAFTLTIAATAWPFWLLFSSANTEGLVAIILAAGVWSVLRRRWWLGAALIALAGALKIFPLALLALLLSRRRYKEFTGALLFAAILTVGSLAILGPTIAVAEYHIAAGLTFIKSTYALAVTSAMLDVNHSLFAPIKFALVGLNRVLYPSTWPAHQPVLLEAAYNVYLALACIFGVVLYFGRIRRLPMLNQVLALTICAVLLPPFSVDYTLLQLFLPLGLLCIYTVESWRKNLVPAGLRASFICFAFLYPIGSFFTIRYRFGSMVRCFALTALLIAVLRHPFPWPELDSEETA